MLLRAAVEHGLSLRDSVLIGDKPSDIQAARSAGVGTAYGVCSSNPESARQVAGADATYPDLAACVDAVLQAR